jgi:YHS domain-containing protein
MRTAIIPAVVLLLMSFAATAATAAEGESKPVKQTTCPVMGGPINKEIFADYDGKRVYFCCAACLETFNKDPEKYIKKLEDQGVVLDKAPGEVWTCSMHPQIRQSGPGKCPVCGMDLVRVENEAAAVKAQTTCPVTGNPIDKKYYADHSGKRVYFCSAACLETFSKDPEKYIKQLEDQGVVPDKAPGEVWTCSMHPQVRLSGPGKCPVCGMNLVRVENEAAAVKAQTTCPVTGNPIDKKYYADHNGKRVYFCCPACIATFNKDPDKYIKQLEDEGVTLETAPDK